MKHFFRLAAASAEMMYFECANPECKVELHVPRNVYALIVIEHDDRLRRAGFPRSWPSCPSR